MPEEIDEIVLIRPTEFATDEEWAGDLTEKLLEAEDRLGTLQPHMEIIERSVKDWRNDLGESGQRIVIRQCDDWIAVYLNEERVFQNHSCSLADGLDALGIGFEDVEVDPDENDPEASFPYWINDA